MARYQVFEASRHHAILTGLLGKSHPSLLPDFALKPLQHKRLDSNPITWESPIWHHPAQEQTRNTSDGLGVAHAPSWACLPCQETFCSKLRRVYGEQVSGTGSALPLSPRECLSSLRRVWALPCSGLLLKLGPISPRLTHLLPASHRSLEAFSYPLQDRSGPPQAPEAPALPSLTPPLHCSTQLLVFPWTGTKSI